MVTITPAIDDESRKASYVVAFGDGRAPVVGPARNAGSRLRLAAQPRLLLRAR